MYLLNDWGSREGRGRGSSGGDDRSGSLDGYDLGARYGSLLGIEGIRSKFLIKFCSPHRPSKSYRIEPLVTIISPAASTASRALRTHLGQYAKI